MYLIRSSQRMTTITTVILLVLELACFANSANIETKTKDSAHFPLSAMQSSSLSIISKRFSLAATKSTDKTYRNVPSQYTEVDNVKIHEDDEMKRAGDNLDDGLLSQHDGLDFVDTPAANKNPSNTPSGMRYTGSGKSKKVNTAMRYAGIGKRHVELSDNRDKNSPSAGHMHSSRLAAEEGVPSNSELHKRDLERIFRHRRDIDEDEYAKLLTNGERPLNELLKRVAEVKPRVGAGMRYAGLGKRGSVGAGMRYAGLGRRGVGAGMRYAGIGKRVGVGAGKRKLNVRSRVDAGMRYMGIGKRPVIK